MNKHHRIERHSSIEFAALPLPLYYSDWQEVKAFKRDHAQVLAAMVGVKNHNGVSV